MPDYGATPPVTPVASRGRVYAALSPRSIRAFNEVDGTVAWSLPIADMGMGITNSTTVLGDKLFSITRSGYYSEGHILKIDADTGAVDNIEPSAAFTSLDDMVPPVGFGSKVYAVESRALQQFSASTSTTDWTSSFGRTVPAVDDNFIYGFGRGSTAGLDLLDRDGNLVHTIVDTGPFSSGEFPELVVPVIGYDGNVYVVDQGHVTSFDPQDRDVNWSTSGQYVSNPVLAANGVLYVANSNPPRVEALRSSNGRMMWSWSLPADETRFIGDMIATDNLLFVSTDKKIHAVDLATLQPVWTYPRPGRMAISSSGLLLIARVSNSQRYGSGEGSLAAINLR